MSNVHILARDVYKKGGGKIRESRVKAVVERVGENQRERERQK